MRHLLWLLLLFSLVANATTWNAASLSESDIQSAINSASAGDIVQLPAGSITHTTGGITCNKAITIQGVGAGRAEGSSATSLSIGTGSKTFTLDRSSNNKPPVVNGLTCSPTSVQTPSGTTSCTATTSSGTPTTWAWSVSSCTAAACSTAGTGNHASFSCSNGGSCTICALAHSVDGDSNNYCTGAGYLTAKYRQPTGLSVH